MLPFRRIRLLLWKLAVVAVSLCVGAPIGNAVWTFFSEGKISINDEAWRLLWNNRGYPLLLITIWIILFLLAYWDEKKFIDHVEIGEHIGATVKRARDLKVGVDVVVPDFRPDVYVPRNVDHLARDVLVQNRAVMIVGMPSSGKTRLAWNLLQSMPSALIVIPNNHTPLAALPSGRLSREDVIIFL